MRVSNLGLKITVLITFTTVCVAGFIYLYTKAGGQLRLKTPYTVKAVVPDPINLVENSDVRLGGHKVGRVVSRSNVGGQGLVTFEIEDRYAPMYRDGRTYPRVKTLVGETYLDIQPGTPASGAVPDGATIPATQADEVVPLERILSTMDPATRQQVRRNLRSLGTGLDGHGGDMNRLFQTARPLVADGGRLMQILRGQRRQLAHAVDDTATVMQAFADRTQQVRTLAVQAKTTAEVVAARDDEMRRIFGELEPTLIKARSSVSKLSGFSGRATPVMRDLRFAMGDLEPTLRDLYPAAVDGRRLFREIPSFIRVADPMLDELVPFTEDLEPAVDSLDAFLRQVAPVANYLRAYDREFGAFFANTSSANNVYDALGALGRVHSITGPTTQTAIANNPDLLAAYNALLEAGILTEELPSQQHENTYPMPGTVGQPGEAQNYDPLKPSG